MSEMQNNRRHQAQKELGLDNTEEELQIEQSIQKEELRQMEKQLRRMEIEQSSSYRTVLSIAKWMVEEDVVEVSFEEYERHP